MAVLVPSHSCSTWPFGLSLEKSHLLVEMAGRAGNRPALAQQTRVREMDVEVTEART